MSIKNLSAAISAVMGLCVILSALWLALSGMFELKMLMFGVASVAFVAYLSLRMDVAAHDGDAIHLHIGLARYYLYWAWLIGQIFQSSIDVCRRVLHPKPPINPAMLEIHGTQKTDVGRVNYANSITRTPGTVTVDMQENRFLVHTLTTEAARELQSGEMDRRVSALEDAQ